MGLWDLIIKTIANQNLLYFQCNIETIPLKETPFLDSRFKL